MLNDFYFPSHYDRCGVSPYDVRRRQQILERQRAIDAERRRRAELERRRQLQEEAELLKYQRRMEQFERHRREEERRRRAAETMEAEMMEAQRMAAQRRKKEEEERRRRQQAQRASYARPRYTVVRGHDGNLCRVMLNDNNMILPARGHMHQEESTPPSPNRSLHEVDMAASSEEEYESDDGESSVETTPAWTSSNVKAKVTVDNEKKKVTVSMPLPARKSRETSRSSFRLTKKNGAKKVDDVVVEDASDDELDDLQSVWRNRLPSPGQWIEPVDDF